MKLLRRKSDWTLGKVLHRIIMILGKRRMILGSKRSMWNSICHLLPRKLKSLRWISRSPKWASHVLATLGPKLWVAILSRRRTIIYSLTLITTIAISLFLLNCRKSSIRGMLRIWVPYLLTQLSWKRASRQWTIVVGVICTNRIHSCVYLTNVLIR